MHQGEGGIVAHRADIAEVIGDPLQFRHQRAQPVRPGGNLDARCCLNRARKRSEEHTSELQSLMRISYAVFCLKKTNNNNFYFYSIYGKLLLASMHLFISFSILFLFFD